MRRWGKEGFTLVELAIVMVIAAIIMSAIFVGQNLIRQAEIKRVISKLQQFDQAANSFWIKFNYWPGDMPIAFQAFGSFSDCTDEVITGYDGTGCNGNANGIIESLVSMSTGGEDLLFWAHLNRAGMLAGHYTGFAADLGASPPSVFAGEVNMPWVGPHQGVAAAMTYPPPGTFTAGYISPPPRLAYILVRIDNEADGLPIASTFTVEEASAIDEIIDDGSPFSGAVLGLGFEGNCVDEDAGTYKYSDTTLACILIYFSQ
jgi:prepilin-type N-terminal cleavage/methylation domain-containing protein